MRTATVLPFATRGEVPLHTVEAAPAGTVYDPQRQVNVLPGGQPLCHTAFAASSTGTNWDSAPDETEDPYRTVG